MVDCLDVARYFIIKAYEDRREASMTNMKVQKLLYYAQSLHLALHDEPLFDEEIQAWRYGPVCPPAYHFFNNFESKQLPIPDKAVLESFSSDVEALLEEVWDYFGDYHAYYLRDMTHLEFPWKKARKDLPPSARSTEPIAVEDMRVLGHEKLDAIEREHPVYKPLVGHILDQTFSSQSPAKRVQKGEVGDWIDSLLD